MNKHDTKIIINVNDVIIKKDGLKFNHVGNRRFHVLLTIFFKSYIDAKIARQTEKINQIIETIINSIKHKAIPNGRFILASKSNGRSLLEIEDNNLIHKIVRSSLRSHVHALSGCSDHHHHHHHHHQVNNCTSTNPIQKDIKLKLEESPVYEAFEKRGSKVNLSDERFVVKDNVVKKSVPKYKTSRKITSKIKRTKNMKAVIRQKKYNLNSLPERKTKALTSSTSCNLTRKVTFHSSVLQKELRPSNSSVSSSFISNTGTSRSTCYIDKFVTDEITLSDVEDFLSDCSSET